MSTFAVVRIVFSYLSAAAVCSNGQLSNTFAEPQKDQVPVAGVTQLSTIVLNSAIKCAQRCLNNGEKASSCGGVIYQAPSCADNNGKPMEMGGICQLVRHSSTQSVVFATKNSSCIKFYSFRGKMSFSRGPLLIEIKYSVSTIGLQQSNLNHSRSCCLSGWRI